MKRFLILLAIGLALVAVAILGLADILTLSGLKAHQQAIVAHYAASPLSVIGLFAAIYVAAAAAAIPGMAILTLAAGAIFGLVEGAVIVSFASSVGATMSFLASRYLFRDRVRGIFAGRLRAIDEGIGRDGSFYLFTIRLVPLFPFFLVNLLMGLTSIPARTFYWVSQVGMLAGTIVYVNAGTQLGQIETIADIVSPGLLASFAALGLFPWAAKWLASLLRRRRIYSRWSKPRRFDRNLVVIGAGAAGLVSSYIGATLKARVTLVEAGKMGGDCLNYGCVPSKALIRSAKLAQQIREGDRFGLGASEPRFRFPEVMERIRKVISAVEPHDSVERYQGLGVDVVHGRARIVDPWTVEIDRHDGMIDRLTTRAIIIAAGAEPIVPPLPGIDGSGYLTSDTLWDEFSRLEEIPRRIVVLGGGPIGCELSQAFARLGAKITQIEQGPRILPREDEDASEIARRALEASGVKVGTGHSALRCEVKDGEKRLIVSFQGVERAIAYDALIIAVGRKARLSGYGLEELGIKTDRTVVTDDYLATVYPNIFAAGDVAGPYQFTHAAAHQAWYASVNALFGQFKKFKADYRVIPWTTFIDPEVARVGLNEQEAREQGIDHEIARFPLHELDRAIADSATSGFVKVLTARGSDKILGVTFVGEHAGELIAEYVLAMKHRLGLKKILGTVHSYPTMAEANKYVAGEWQKSHAPQPILRLVERYHRWRLGPAGTGPSSGPGFVTNAPSSSN